MLVKRSYSDTHLMVKVRKVVEIYSFKIAVNAPNVAEIHGKCGVNGGVLVFGLDIFLAQ